MEVDESRLQCGVGGSSDSGGGVKSGDHVVATTSSSASDSDATATVPGDDQRIKGLYKCYKDELKVVEHSPDNQRKNQLQTAIEPHLIVCQKYKICEKIDGSSLRNCVEINTGNEYVCKIGPKRESTIWRMIVVHHRVHSEKWVTPLYETVHDEGKMYLIFARSYGDLHTHVRLRRRLNEYEARPLFRQIVHTVVNCHQRGIILRDLKLRKFVFADPEKTTIRLETLEDAILLDANESDELMDKRGCPAYVSPEILQSHSKYSGRAADIWSIGVILYTMLVGRYPFADMHHPTLFAKISRGYFTIPEYLSPKARCLIRSLLRQQPAERLPASDILFHPWFKGDSKLCSYDMDQIVPDIDD